MQVLAFILHTMDPSNVVMRRTCFQSSMVVLKELVLVFPMVALNDTSTRLAVGDAIADINSAIIRVYDMQRYELCLKFHNFSREFLFLILKFIKHEWKMKN